MTLTQQPTMEMPWGMMEVVSTLRLRDAVDRFGDYVLFRITDEAYVIVGPYAETDDQIVSYWFGHGWGYSVEDVGGLSIAHVTLLPNVPLMHRMS